MGFGKISDKVLGTWIRSIHSAIPILTMLFIYFGGPVLVLVTFCLTIVVGLVFIIRGNCVLSIYEQRLLNDDVYSIDFIIEILGIRVNEKNRYWLTIVMGALYHITQIAVIEWRFGLL